VWMLRLPGVNGYGVKVHSRAFPGLCMSQEGCSPEPGEGPWLVGSIQRDYKIHRNRGSTSITL
jgi:hypothetical protein